MIKIQKNLNLVDYTLILPSVAVGNVGQLSVDLLIKVLKFQHAGSIFDTSFIPIIGANPYDELSEDTCTSIDLYISDVYKLVALQIRSPVVKRTSKFIYEILNFVANYKITEVFILTSSYSYEKQDNHTRSPLQYLASENIEEKLYQHLEDLSQTKLGTRHLDDIYGQTVSHIHGSGFAKTLFESLKKKNICCVILFKLCSEGDNIIDAIKLIHSFNQWPHRVSIDEQSFRKSLFPPSWKFLFGNSLPEDIY